MEGQSKDRGMSRTEDILRDKHQQWFDKCKELEDLETTIGAALCVHYNLQRGTVVRAGGRLMAIHKIENANVAGRYSGTKRSRRGSFPSLSCDCFLLTKKRKFHQNRHTASFNTNSAFEILGQADANDRWRPREPIEWFEEE